VRGKRPGLITNPADRLVARQDHLQLVRRALDQGWLLCANRLDDCKWVPYDGQPPQPANTALQALALNAPQLLQPGRIRLKEVKIHRTQYLTFPSAPVRHALKSREVWLPSGRTTLTLANFG